MSLYSMIFGKNLISALLLEVLGKKESDFGRFRDIYLTRMSDDGPLVIAVYTRNGGGNRDCWHEGSTKYGCPECKHHEIQEEVDEIVILPQDEIDRLGYEPLNVHYGGGKRMAKTGRRVMETYYVCDAPDSPDCHCVGCFMTYHVHKIPGYICDRDDDFDSTYATIYLSIPDDLKGLLGELYDADMKTPEDRWVELIEGLRDSSTAEAKRVVDFFESLKESL